MKISQSIWKYWLVLKIVLDFHKKFFRWKKNFFSYFFGFLKKKLYISIPIIPFTKKKQQKNVSLNEKFHSCWWFIFWELLEEKEEEEDLWGKKIKIKN